MHVEFGANEENGKYFWSLAQNFLRSGLVVVTEGREALLSMDDPSEMIESLSPKIAGKFQDKWFQDLYKDPKNLDIEGNLIPRMRKAVDPDWCEQNGVSVSDHEGERAYWFDMVKYPKFEDLPANYQEENRRGAEDALWETANHLRNVVSGHDKLGVASFWVLGEIVHLDWIKRNPARDENDRKREVYGRFVDLSLAEKNKDLAWVVEAAEAISEYLRENK